MTTGKGEKTFDPETLRRDTPVGEVMDAITLHTGPWPYGWSQWDNVRRAHLELLKRHTRNILTIPYPEGRYRGRGVVQCVSAKPGSNSGKNLENGYLPSAWASVRELRRHGCTLPVYWAYLGMVEWDPWLEKIVREHLPGVITEDLEVADAQGDSPMRILNGWEAKVAAIYHSPFEEVIFLDADNLPLRDPTVLLDSDPYKDRGAIFWPDAPHPTIKGQGRTKWIPDAGWDGMGLPRDSHPPIESGQLVINKRKCWHELLLTLWVNGHSDYYYDSNYMLFGDKDTFLLSWLRWASEAGSPPNFYFIPSGPGGVPCSLLQHGLDGKPMFQHLTQNKATLHGFLGPGHNDPDASRFIVNQSACLSHLAELARLWTGRVWTPGEKTQEERDKEKSLEGRVFFYVRHVSRREQREVRFVQDNTVGKGKAKCEAEWRVIGTPGRWQLMLLDIEGAPTAVLTEQQDGSWAGRWLRYERCPCELLPVED